MKELKTVVETPAAEVRETRVHSLGTKTETEASKEGCNGLHVMKLNILFSYSHGIKQVKLLV